MTYIRSLHGRPDKDREADTVIRDLVERTGESMTDAVKRAVRERLQ
jgi:hypothetical protein